MSTMDLFKVKLIDVFQVRKCGIESLKNTIEIPDIVEERIAMVYEEILKKGNMRRK